MILIVPLSCDPKPSAGSGRHGPDGIPAKAEQVLLRADGVNGQFKHVAPHAVEFVDDRVEVVPWQRLVTSFSSLALKFSKSVSGFPREFILMYSSSPEGMSSMGRR